MKTQYLLTLLIFFLHITSNAQPDGPGADPDLRAISISDTLISISLIQGDNDQKSVFINNSSAADYTIGTRLTNSYYETETNPSYLSPPLLFKIYGRIIEATSAGNEPFDQDWKVLLPRGFQTWRNDGLTFDGRFVYISQTDQNGLIYKVDPLSDSFIDTTYVAEFENKLISGLAHSGKFLYAANMDDNLIYQFDFDNGTIINQIAVENLGKGLAFGGNRGTLFALLSTSEVAEINIVTGEVINTFSGTYASEGLAYSKQTGLVWADYGFYENTGHDPDTGEELRRVDQWGHSLAGDGTFGLEWLDLESVTFDLPTGTTQQLNLSFDASSLEAGTYYTTIEYGLNDANNTSVSLPVELTILPIVEELTVESFCSSTPDDENIWKIHNPNFFDLHAQWNVLGSTYADSIILKPGENTLFTPMIPDMVNTLKVAWLDEREVIQESLTDANSDVCRIRGITTTGICSEDLLAYRTWQISNPNLFNVYVNWYVEGTDLSGSHIAAPGVTDFSTPVDSLYEVQTLKVEWFNENGQIKRQRKISSSEPCRIRGLVLTPVCSEEPDLTNKWEIYNQNPFSVSVDWDLFGYDIGGNINAKAGVSYLYTPSEIEYQIMKISWRDADNNIRRQQKLWYVDDCTGQAPGLARKSSVAVDSEPVDPLVDFVKIFPNPFSDNLIIKIPFDNDDGNSARSLNIYNSLGSRVYQVDSKREWNSSQIEINTSNFPSGTYIVVLDGKNLRRKAVIIKK